MEIADHSLFRKDLKSHSDKVFSDHSTVIIPTKGKNLVLLPKTGYDRMLKTFYVIESPKNANGQLGASKMPKTN